MTLLYAGLALWVLAHLFPVLMVDARKSVINRMGEKPYTGLFAVIMLAALLMIIFGWRAATPEFVYAPPPGLRHPAMLLVVIAFIFFAASHSKNSRIKHIVRHPQLVSVLIWAVAHLMANGDSRSVALFGTMAVWSIISIIFINLRDGTKPALEQPNPWWREGLVVVIGVVLATIVVKFHQYLAGIALMPTS